MFVFDDITLILSGAVLLIAFAAPFMNVILARVKQDDDEDAAEGAPEKNAPGISVVVTVGDESEELRDNLPAWLGQEYGGEFQVIVVVSGNDDAVENVLKTYAGDSRLYTTFIPASSRYMSRRKLALTLGVKAAKYDWILFTDVDCRPDGNGWLGKMAEKCADGTDIVLGYSNFADDDNSVRLFDQAYTACRQLRDAQNGRAWGYCGNNMLFRKRMFLDGKGFDGNLKYIRGEYDFLVNKFADSANVAVQTGEEARVTQSEMTKKCWKNKCLFYMSTRKHLASAIVPRLKFNATMWAMAVSYLACIAAVAFSVVCQMWILTIAAGVALVLTSVLRAMLLKRSLGMFLPEMSAVAMLWHELTLPLRNFVRLLRYRFTDKYDFICHKI